MIEGEEDRSVYIYDIETLKSCFTYTGYNINTKEIVQYVLHKDRFELDELIKHLKFCKYLIGFNNINFDYPIIHFILNQVKKDIWESCEYEEIINDIYKEAQKIIEVQNNSMLNPVFISIRDSEVLIPQLDLFRIWHYDNKARSTSLKALEVSMNYPNVMDMPISHTKEDITLEEIDNILEYNLNDVLATYEFYKKTIENDKINLRKLIRSKYKLPCLNWNNGKIGENLILKLYCDKTGLNPWEVRKLRSKRLQINLKDCVPDNIYFKSNEFNKLLDFYNNKTVTETKGSVDYSLIFKGVKYQYGTGGTHAAIKSGLYESNDKYIIKSCDVSSLYPNLPIVYGFYIEHLGIEFLEVYKNDIVGVRLAEKSKPKDQQDKAIIDGYKEAANIPYGKSNDINSFLYDPLYCLKTTISGQLVISMLCEQLSNIPNSQILMVNTDGAEIKIPRKYEELYNNICKSWEKHTNLVLEFEDYKKMWLADINNYGSISFKGKIKNKGRFEVNKVIGNEPAYHKDNSFKIVPLAIQEFFVNNIPVEETIKNHKNIYDFCGRQKFKGKDYGFINIIKDNKIVTEKQQKIVRYYISTNGSSFIKAYQKGSNEVINKGYLVTIFNRFIEKEWKDYNINYKFYIKQCYKEIDEILNKQIELKF